MTEKYIIETINLRDGKVDSKYYTEIVGKPETKREANPESLIPDYKNFYTKIIKAHTKIIKKTNLEKIITTFEI